MSFFENYRDKEGTCVVFYLLRIIYSCLIFITFSPEIIGIYSKYTFKKYYFSQVIFSQKLNFANYN